jgi:ApaG protein
MRLESNLGQWKGVRVMPHDDDNPDQSERISSGRAARARSRRADQRAAQDAYCKTTRGVCVSVRSFYLADQSQPDDSHFVWAYRVKIENQSREAVQLLRRTWQITDARGRTQHVHGAGVVGEQPLLEPGESFEYTSGTPLDTPSGFMVGAYHMVIASSGENFDVAIPPFSLDSPHQTGRVH